VRAFREQEQLEESLYVLRVRAFRDSISYYLF